MKLVVFVSVDSGSIKSQRARTPSELCTGPQPNAPQPGERHGELMILVSNQKVFGKGADLHCNSHDDRARNARTCGGVRRARGAHHGHMWPGSLHLLSRKSIHSRTETSGMDADRSEDKGALTTSE